MKTQRSNRRLAGALALLGLLSMGMTANAEAGGHGHRAHAAKNHYAPARPAVRHGIRRAHRPYAQVRRAYRQGYRQGVRQQRRRARAWRAPRAAYARRAPRYSYGPSGAAISLWFDGIRVSYYDY